MRFSTVLPLFAAAAFAQNSSSLGPDKDGKYTISSEGIRGHFIPYGASVSNLFVKGKDGVERDIVLGFDNATAYEGEVHPHFGGVPGRYANRIRNSTFSIDGETFHIEPNENNNNDTLHGGPDGWDYRNFTVVSQTQESITFSIATTKKTPIMLTSHVSRLVFWHIKARLIRIDLLEFGWIWQP